MRALLVLIVFLITNCQNNTEIRSIEDVKNELSDNLRQIREESLKSNPFDGLDLII